MTNTKGSVDTTFFKKTLLPVWSKKYAWFLNTNTKEQKCCRKSICVLRLLVYVLFVLPSK